MKSRLTSKKSTLPIHPIPNTTRNVTDTFNQYLHTHINISGKMNSKLVDLQAYLALSISDSLGFVFILEHMTARAMTKNTTLI